MQPPSMPEFYSSGAATIGDDGDEMGGNIGGGSGRVRKRSSSQGPPSNNGEQNVSGVGGRQYGGNLQTDIAKMAWEAGSSKVKQAFFLYTNIDLFRPYFDVEPKQVRNRLFQSLIPRAPSSMQSMGADLYGPFMLILTLVAILLYSMKISGFESKDGTLIGTAFFTCFTYWFFASMGVYALGYVFVSRIGMVQTFSVLGYALFCHCLVLSISSLLHHFFDSHAAFYALFAVFGGLSSLRMAIFFASKTPAKTHKMILAAVVLALHLGFLLYLHFGYHKVVEEISEMLGEEHVNSVPHHLPDAPPALLPSVGDNNDGSPLGHVTAAVSRLARATVKRSIEAIGDSVAAVNRNNGSIDMGKMPGPPAAFTV